MKPFYKITCFTVILLFLSTWAYGSGSSSDVKWFNYGEGLTVAKKQSKKIFILFRADWCGYCRKMEHGTFKDPAVVAYLKKHYISIKVDTEKNRDLAMQYKVMGLPSCWFLKKDGEPIGNLPGYNGPEQFLNVLKMVQDNDTKTK